MCLLCVFWWWTLGVLSEVLWIGRWCYMDTDSVMADCDICMC